MKPSCRKFAVGLLWAFAGLGFAGVVLGIVPWLLTRHPQHGLTAEQRLKARNDVRATVVQTVAGLALAGGLIVTYRTYRQNRDEQDRNYRLRQAEQVNEVYTKAVEQLGHELAPVRLGALFSLEELAQHNPAQRQTVVNVLCAYLRMPFAPPDRQGRSPLANAGLLVRRWLRPAPSHDPVQELRVRKAAQEILSGHLACPGNVSGEAAQQLRADPGQRFWPRVTLDLTGAALIDFHLDNASIDRPNFTRATFTGFTRFRGVTLLGGALFNHASFNDGVWFAETYFVGGAGFRNATFRDARFNKVTFTAQSMIDFEETTFGLTDFLEATFSGGADFEQTRFGGTGVSFHDTTFNGRARFREVTFASNARLRTAIFVTEPSFENVKVLRLDRLYLIRDWPKGWSVRPDRDSPTRGTLHRSGPV